MQKPDNKKGLNESLITSILMLICTIMLSLGFYFCKATGSKLFFPLLFFGTLSLTLLLMIVVATIGILKFKQELYLEKLDEYREFRKSELRKEMNKLEVEINNIEQKQIFNIEE